MEIGARSDTSF